MKYNVLLQRREKTKTGRKKILSLYIVVDVDDGEDPHAKIRDVTDADHPGWILYGYAPKEIPEAEACGTN